MNPAGVSPEGGKLFAAHAGWSHRTTVKTRQGPSEWAALVVSINENGRRSGALVLMFYSADQNL